MSIGRCGPRSTDLFGRPEFSILDRNFGVGGDHVDVIGPRGSCRREFQGPASRPAWPGCGSSRWRGPGPECEMTTNAIPVSAGRCRNNSESASSPPADAPTSDDRKRSLGVRFQRRGRGSPPRLRLRLIRLGHGYPGSCLTPACTDRAQAAPPTAYRRGRRGRSPHNNWGVAPGTRARTLQLGRCPRHPTYVRDNFRVACPRLRGHGEVFQTPCPRGRRLEFSAAILRTPDPGRFRAPRCLTNPPRHRFPRH